MKIENPCTQQCNNCARRGCTMFKYKTSPCTKRIAPPAPRGFSIAIESAVETPHKAQKFVALCGKNNYEIKTVKAWPGTKVIVHGNRR